MMRNLHIKNIWLTRVKIDFIWCVNTDRQTLQAIFKGIKKCSETTTKKQNKNKNTTHNL